VGSWGNILWRFIKGELKILCGDSLARRGQEETKPKSQLMIGEYLLLGDRAEGGQKVSRSPVERGSEENALQRRLLPPSGQLRPCKYHTTVEALAV
jgi:hypothetical protein